MKQLENLTLEYTEAIELFSSETLDIKQMALVTRGIDTSWWTEVFGKVKNAVLDFAMDAVQGSAEAIGDAIGTIVDAFQTSKVTRPNGDEIKGDSINIQTKYPDGTTETIIVVTKK